MPPLMSFSLTTPQMYATLHQRPGDPKSATRRKADTWKRLQPGDVVEACEKTMGLRRGDHIVRIGLIQITEVWVEAVRRMLDETAYGRAEVVKEGFPRWTPEQFVEMLCKHNGLTVEDEVRRFGFVPYVAPRPVAIQLRLL